MSDLTEEERQDRRATRSSIWKEALRLSEKKEMRDWVFRYHDKHKSSFIVKNSIRNKKTVMIEGNSIIRNNISTEVKNIKSSSWPTLEDKVSAIREAILSVMVPVEDKIS